jgi:hypothetical protein
MNKYAKRIFFEFNLEEESHEPLTQNFMKRLRDNPAVLNPGLL